MASLILDDSGWIDVARHVPSPNCDDRPAGESIDLIVIHAISLPPNVFDSGDIDRLFTNTLDPQAHPFFASIAALRVSAHFLIARNGCLTQYVSCLQRAWHAGVSAWDGRERCNDFSLGIELEGCDSLAFSDQQYTTLRSLVAVLKSHYPVREVQGHSQIAPTRKTDPGPFFDWRRSGLRGS